MIPVEVAQLLENDDGTQSYFVQGNMATLPEYNLAVALFQLGFEFTYEAQLLGGRGAAGGIEIDFIVDVKPWPIGIWVHGEYWHSGSQRDRDIMQMLRAEEVFGGEINTMEVFEDDLVPNVEDALAWARREVI